MRFGCKPLRPCVCATSNHHCCAIFLGGEQRLSDVGFNSIGRNLVNNSPVRVLIVDDYESLASLFFNRPSERARTTGHRRSVRRTGSSSASRTTATRPHLARHRSSDAEWDRNRPSNPKGFPPSKILFVSDNRSAGHCSGGLEHGCSILTAMFVTTSAGGS